MRRYLCLLLLLWAALALAAHAAVLPPTGAVPPLLDDDPSPSATPTATPEPSAEATATRTPTATATASHHRLRLPIIVSSFVALPTPTPTRPPTWIIHHVDRGDSAAAEPSLALDAAAHAYIGYYLCFGEPPRNCEIRCAYWTGTAWVISVVDANPGFSGPSVGGPFLAVDSNKHPHISYYRRGAGGDLIVYASWTGAAWEFQVVDIAAYAGPATSLALDAADRPHIAYYDHTYNQIRYAMRTGAGVWQIETLATAVGAGTDISLALDSAGRPHIAYWVRTSTGFDLRYSFRTASIWIHRQVAISGRTVVRPSLALDAQDRPHIAYGYYTDLPQTYVPVHVYWTGSIWETTSIGLPTADMRAISLALDAAGNPRVAYDRLVSGRQTLMYAWWLGPTWGWAEQALDPEVGWGISLALDTQGNPHIGYEAEGTAGLRYAHRGGP